MSNTGTMKTVMITGASTGIGRACALRLDEAGWRVFAGVRKESDGEALVRAASDRLTPVIIDVADQDSIDAAADLVNAAVGGRLDGLVNNAGITVQGPLEHLPLDAFRKQLEVNVTGQLAVSQALLPSLRTAKGRIVFMGSVAGRAPSVPFLGPYSASKKALEAVADSLRGELKPAGIHVAIVEPGSIATEIWDKATETADADLEMVPQENLDYYETAMRKATSIAGKVGARGIPADVVAKKVEHALTSSRPRTRYLVGKDAYARVFIESNVPDKLRDRVAARILFKD